MALPPALNFTGTGLNTSVGAVVSFYNGLGLDAGGALVTTASAPTFNINGNPAIATGQIATVAKASAVTPLQFQNGLQFDANGRLVTVTVALATAPVQSQNRFNFDATGALVIA